MPDQPKPVDQHVGRRLRQRRTLLGLSQERLGELLGVTYQQIQKYERGANRIGSSRLHDIGRHLDVPVAYFFDGMAEPTPEPRPSHGLAEAGDGFLFDAPGLFRPPPAEPRDGVEERETLELVRAFNRIKDPLVRRRLFELAKALAGLAYRDAGDGDA